MNKIAAQGMLTKTYTSLALSYEQKNAWQVLAKLNACLQQAKCGAVDAQRPVAALQEFAAAERYYRDRRLARHVIPAIRERVPQANGLLDELDALAAGSARTLQQARALQGGAGQSADQVPYLLRAMEQYCQQLLARLRKEESELIPLAFRALTPEEWFAIAVQCLPQNEGCAKKAA